jgi:hypothetical protein
MLPPQAVSSVATDRARRGRIESNFMVFLWASSAVLGLLYAVNFLTLNFIFVNFEQILNYWKFFARI